MKLRAARSLYRRSSTLLNNDYEDVDGRFIMCMKGLDYIFESGFRAFQVVIRDAEHSQHNRSKPDLGGTMSESKDPGSKEVHVNRRDIQDY